MYPTETTFAGSTRAFTALTRSMWGKGKVALVWAVLRKNSAPRMAILLPALDRNVLESASSPQGMYLVSLPFVDDLRDPPSQEIHKGMFYLIQHLIFYSNITP